MAQQNDIGVTAAAALLPWLTAGEARAISARVAFIGVRIEQSRLSERTLQTLVSAASDEWADALEALVRQPIFPSPSLFVHVLPHLPFRLQQRVATAVYHTASEWELPWISNLRYGELGRPADVARRALYDAGLQLTD